MKKIIQLIFTFILIFFLNSCWLLQDRTLAVEPAYYFTCEFEIENKSPDEITVFCETVALGSTEAMMMQDTNTIVINKNSSDSLSHNNIVGLCGAPRLSYILRINEEMYTGFDSSVTSLCDYSWKEIEKVNAKQYALGLVDWTVDEQNPTWESCFSGYEKCTVKIGVTASYKVVIAENGDVTINLISLTDPNRK